MAVDRDRLHASEGAAEALQRLADGLQRHAQLQSGRRRGHGVVDVVEAGEGEPHGERALRGPQLDARATHAVELHPRGGDLRDRSLAAAVGAAVAAHVAKVDRLVDVRVAAVAAVLRVGGVLHAGQRLGVVLHAEVGHLRAVAPEVGDQRVVGVEHEARPPVQPLDQLRPAVGEQLELAIAVELVAEQVGEQQQPRVELLGHARQPGLVDLEQPQLPAPAPGVEQGGGHSPRHVGPGAVVDDGAPGALEAGRQHRGRGRLAVRGRDQQRALVEVAGHPAQRPRREAQQQRPGAVVPPVRPRRRLAARSSRASARAGAYIRPGR